MTTGVTAYTGGSRTSRRSRTMAGVKSVAQRRRVDACVLLLIATAQVITGF